MADTHSHTHTTHAASRSDMGAAFAGLVIGAIALLLILGTIVRLTNRHYESEKPAAATQR
ncbi:MAG TPA: hypothetical protein VH080_08720 [Gemmatimonadaceae bacterium]|jgi:hypothetical protein|nr:hypothetical protein [Gemmatimonadaceae bacterium]